MIRSLLDRFLVAVAAAWVAAPVQGAVVWSQMDYLTLDFGPPATSINPDLKTYDDFRLSVPTRIHGISWAGLGNSFPAEGQHLTTPFTIEIWASTAPSVGLRTLDTLLAQWELTFPAGSDAVTNIDMDPSIAWIAISTNSYQTRYRYDAVLDAPFEAQANTYYWIGIYNNEKSFHWQVVTNNTGDPANQRPQIPPNSTSGSDVAFELKGTVVPLPSAVFFAVPGLAILARLRRRNESPAVLAQKGRPRGVL